ncbi:protein rolling stone-like isoform X2 [Populus alba x Populus x berolinensis]|nr:protein rolling stone-like isoform X2 [Populus alba x Populus x berolinensis]
MLIMIYFALGTVMSAYGCWVSLKQPAVSEHGENSVFLKRDVEEDGTATSITYKEKKSGGTIKLRSHCAEEAIRERAGFWGYLMQIIYQTCAGAVILTDIIFWCIIVPFLSNTHLGLNSLMGCMHSLNAVFLLLDTALNSLPFPWFRLAYFVQWSCLYVIFQWVIHACGFTWWPYPFLELNTPWAPLWYFAMAVIHIPCYGIYALIFKAKNTIFPRLFPRSFVRSY